jgi:hypothetical protein
MPACEVYDEYADTSPNKHENVARLHPKNSDTAPNCVIALPPALSPSMELMEEDLPPVTGCPRLLDALK